MLELAGIGSGVISMQREQVRFSAGSSQVISHSEYQPYLTDASESKVFCKGYSKIWYANLGKRNLVFVSIFFPPLFCPFFFPISFLLYFILKFALSFHHLVHCISCLFQMYSMGKSYSLHKWKILEFLVMNF